MQSAGICGDRSFTLGVWECSEHDSRDVTENDAAEPVGQRDIDAVDCEIELTVLICFRNDSWDVFRDSGR